jgi:lysozyme
MGDRATVAECEGMLIDRLEEFNAEVNRCVHAPMSDGRRAATVSFFYNVGSGAGCASSYVRKLNAGDPSACDELLRWDRAKGVRLPGLTRRRAEERRLCLS